MSEGETDFKQELGYCLQGDALDGLLTGTETIYFYAKLRGIPSSNIKLVNLTWEKCYTLQIWSSKFNAWLAKVFMNMLKLIAGTAVTLNW